MRKITWIMIVGIILIIIFLFTFNYKVNQLETKKTLDKKSLDSKNITITKEGVNLSKSNKTQDTIDTIPLKNNKKTTETSTSETTATNTSTTSQGTALLELLNYSYELNEQGHVKLNSITYKINNNFDTIKMDILLYIYDIEDNEAKKGLVRDQINLGTINLNQTITATKSVNAFYVGDLSKEKTVKINLIGWVGARSYQLASNSKQALFN
jgi:cytoskeletal protein RodZ